MTLSIIAKSEKTLGAGAVPESIAVRNRVPRVKSKVGAIATRSYIETRHGGEGLKPLRKV